MTSTVMGVGGLIVGVIVILVLTTTILTANLLGTTDSTENLSVWGMQDNFTTGINNVATKVPTILLIVAVVFLFGALVLLVRQASAMGIGGGGSSL